MQEKKPPNCLRTRSFFTAALLFSEDVGIVWMLPVNVTAFEIFTQATG